MNYWILQIVHLSKPQTCFYWNLNKPINFYFQQELQEPLKNPYVRSPKLVSRLTLMEVQQLCVYMDSLKTLFLWATKNPKPLRIINLVT